MALKKPNNPTSPDGWHSRGYLPHFDGGEIPQFITFRLGDSMPQAVLQKWRTELGRESGIDVEAALRRRIEAYLDQGYGECHLSHPNIAESVQDSILFFDRDRYRLFAWVVMPNHVHLLITPCQGHALSRILQSLKGYTANEVNKLLGREGQLWQRESFDRYIRDGDHFAKVVEYIENNPVKARLCKSPEDWPFSSAWFRVRGKR